MRLLLRANGSDAKIENGIGVTFVISIPKEE